MNAEWLDTQLMAYLSLREALGFRTWAALVHESPIGT
jgi:hypothetical protein